MRLVVIGLAAVAAVALAGCSCGDVSPDAPTRVGADAGTTHQRPDAGTGAGTDAGTGEEPILRGPLSIDAGGDRGVCSGRSIVIGPFPQPGFTYRWSPSQGLSSTTEARTTASPQADTTYRVDVTAPDGRKGSATVRVAVHPLPLAQAGQGGAVCPGGTVALGAPAQPGLRYLWLPAQGLDDPRSASPHASPAGTTTYTVGVVDAFGCSASAPVTVAVWSNPELAPIAPQVVESGGSATLAGAPEGGTPPYQLAWTSEDGSCDGAPCSATPTQASTVVTPAATTAFTLSVLDGNGCAARQSTEVTVLDPLLVSAGGDRAICAGDSLTLGGAPEGGLAPYAFAWSSDVACAAPDCIDDPAAQSPTVTPSQETTFLEQVTDALGATASASARISVLPDPGVAGDDVYVAPGGSTLIGPPPLADATYAWTCNRVDCALSSQDVAQPLVSPTHSTRYALSASSGPGCVKDTETTAWVGLEVVSAPEQGDPGYPVSAALQVQFDQPMLAGSFDPSRVQLTDAETGDLLPSTARYDPDTRTLTVRPPPGGTQGYSSGKDYTLILAGGPSGVVSDDPVLPNVFLGDWYLDFTTGAADTTPPTVIYRTPPAGALAAATNSAVQATFDEPLDPATVTEATFHVQGPAGEVSGSVAYDFQSHTATFVPLAPLDVTTLYTVTLAGVADLSGNLGGDSWSFTTGTGPDLTPPTVIAVTPADGAVAVRATAAVALAFSEPVYPGSFLGIRLLDRTNGGSVGGTLRYDATRQVATFTPSGLLPGASTFEVQVDGVQDLAGNALSPPFVSHFTTLRTLFWDDFEHGTGKWDLPPNQAGVSWGLDTKGAMSPRHSLSDSPGARFAPNVVSIAQTAAPVDVTGVSDLVIEFAMRTRTQRKSDYFYLDYRLDGGSWITLGRPGKSEGWNGNGPWVRWTIPQTLSGASALDLRLRLVTDGDKDRDGVYVDDIALQAP